MHSRQTAVTTKLYKRSTYRVSDPILSSTSQLELPMETVTGPTLQAGQPSDNLVDTKLLVEPWNRLTGIMFASPSGRGKQGPEVTSIMGPQTPADWPEEAKSTQAPVIHTVPLMTHLLPQGKHAEWQQLNSIDDSTATPLIYDNIIDIIILIIPENCVIFLYLTATWQTDHVGTS